MKNKGKCEVFTAPFDVRLPKRGETADDKIDTVVQPDICVICDLSKLDERGCCGAPDMIVEVLSPSTYRKDVTEKFALYEESGVKEYWMVHPKDKAINVFLLQEDGKYDAGSLYELKGKVPVHIFDDCLIDLDDIFEI
jgi:Uma2 family endonuclease